MNIDELCISEEKSILDAMGQLDSLATKILFVVKEGKLAAALTDGDIRRWILLKGDLNASVKFAANYQPLYIKNNSSKDIFDFLKEHDLEAVPVVNEEMVIERIVFRNENDIKRNSEILDLPVVMMAGGKGTRLYPYTKILPKPLIPVGEIPIAEHIIEQYKKYGCKNYFLIVNHKKNMIKAYFNEIEKDYNVYYIDEEFPLGTGGGLSLLKRRISSTFILTNCDILVKEDFSKVYKFHKEKGNVITVVCSLKNFQIPYGIVDIAKSGELERMREKPELSFFTNTGCYIVEPEVIEEMEDNVPISFPDIIQKYKDRGESVGIYPIGEKAWLDMGQMDGLEHMRNVLEADEKK